MENILQSRARGLDGSRALFFALGESNMETKRCWLAFFDVTRNPCFIIGRDFPVDMNWQDCRNKLMEDFGQESNWTRVEFYIGEF